MIDPNKDGTKAIASAQELLAKKVQELDIPQMAQVFQGIEKCSEKLRSSLQVVQESILIPVLDLQHVSFRVWQTFEHVKILLIRIGSHTNLDDEEEFWRQLQAAARYVGISEPEFLDSTMSDLCAVLELKALEVDDRRAIAKAARVLLELSGSGILNPSSKMPAALNCPGPQVIEEVQQAEPAIFPETTVESKTLSEKDDLYLSVKRKCNSAGIPFKQALLAKESDPGWNDRTWVARWMRDDARCTLLHDQKIRAALNRMASRSRKS